MVYAALTYSATQLFFSKGRTAENADQSSRQNIAQYLLELPFGRWILGGIALGTAGVGVFQLYLALSGSYRKIIEEQKIDTRAKEILVRSGKVGYVARSIVWFIIGYFLFQAALHADSSVAGDTDTALNYLEYEYGSITLAVVGLGLVSYGIFQFVRAKYQPIIRK